MYDRIDHLYVLTFLLLLPYHDWNVYFLWGLLHHFDDLGLVARLRVARLVTRHRLVTGLVTRLVTKLIGGWVTGGLFTDVCNS